MSVLADWLVAFSATAGAASLSWTAHRLRQSVEDTLDTVRDNERRSIEHRLALEREGISIPDLNPDDTEGVRDDG